MIPGNGYGWVREGVAEEGRARNPLELQYLAGHCRAVHYVAALVSWWLLEGQYAVTSMELDAVMKIVLSGVAGLAFTLVAFFVVSLLRAPAAMDAEKQAEVEREKASRVHAEQIARAAEQTISVSYPPELEIKLRGILANSWYPVYELIEHIVIYGPVRVDDSSVLERLGGKNIFDMAVETDRLIVVRDGRYDVPQPFRPILSRIIFEYTNQRS